jgi:hypothetical protein
MLKRLVNKSMRLINNIGGYKPSVDQGAIDAYRAALLLRGNEWYHKPENVPNKKPTKEDIDQFYNDVDAMEDDDLRDYSQKRLLIQVTNLFENIHQSLLISSDEIDSSTAHNNSNKHNDPIEKLRKKHSNDRDNDGEVVAATTKSNANTNLVDSVGFLIECKKSTCNDDNAGMGLFIRCPSTTSVPPGTVVAFFPGLVHLPEFTVKNDYITDNLLPDPDYMLILREDNTIIDSRTASECPINPYGLAHYVNHVPKNGDANVFQFPFDFPGDPLGIDQFPRKLCKYIPNEYAKKPTILGTVDRSAYMRGMILMTTRPMHDGDELFMDYRLNSIILPKWYHAYDEKAFTSEADKEARSK